MTDHPLSVGILGWGNAARNFHIPILQTLPNLRLTSVVTTRREEAERALPGVRVHASKSGVLDDPAIDLVVVATPHLSHFELAQAALEKGKHVVVEKPLALVAEQARTLYEYAQAKGRLLFAFQNRRWDGDYQTVKELLESQRLGQVYYFQTIFPLYRPQLRGVWREDPAFAGGMLYDLGPHLIDQVIALFGAPKSVYARVAARRDGARTDDYFTVHLVYASGLEALLMVDLLNPFPGPRFHVRGSRGSIEKYGLDSQEAALRAGQLPTGEGWGADPESNWGTLRMRLPSGETVEEKVRTIPGDYRRFYAAVYSAICSGEEFPVRPRQVILQLQVLEAAMKSAQGNCIQTFEGMV